MRFTEQELKRVIDVLIIVPLIIFTAYYFIGVVYYQNIHQYTQRYITEIKYAVNGWSLTEHIYVSDPEVPESEF